MCSWRQCVQVQLGMSVGVSKFVDYAPWIHPVNPPSGGGPGSFQLLFDFVLVTVPSSLFAPCPICGSSPSGYASMSFLASDQNRLCLSGSSTDVREESYMDGVSISVSNKYEEELEIGWFVIVTCLSLELKVKAKTEISMVEELIQSAMSSGGFYISSTWRLSPWPRKRRELRERTVREEGNRMRDSIKDTPAIDLKLGLVIAKLSPTDRWCPSCSRTL